MTKKTLIRLVGAATCVAVMGAGLDAEAGWWRRHHGSSGGSWGSSGGSSGGSWGSHGSSGGSSGGSWSYSSHGSSGGSYSYSSHGSSGGSHGSSGGSWGSHGSSGGGYVVHHHHHTAMHDEPVEYHETVIVNEVVRTTPADTAKIVVDLPKDAKVFINGSETKATGSSRQFISKGLKDGITYQYDVRIVTADKESPMEQTKIVKLSRGETETVRFDAATATAVKPASPKSDAVAATSGN